MLQYLPSDTQTDALYFVLHYKSNHYFQERKSFILLMVGYLF